MSETERSGDVGESAAQPPAGSVAHDVVSSFSDRSRRLDLRSVGSTPPVDGLTPSVTPGSEVPTFDFAPDFSTAAGTSAVPSEGHLGSVASSVAAPAPAVPKKPSRRSAPHQTRKARLRVSRVDPWSVMKTALLFGVAAWIIFVVATWVVFSVLDVTGIYQAINDTFAKVFSSSATGSTFDIKDYVNTTRATALAALIGAVDVILMTALATVFAFLYNLSANVMGGIEVTLAED